MFETASLTKRNWQDAPFERLVHDIVAPVSGGRVALEGPHVDARTALSITMVLNELLTNAPKYGALSIPERSAWLTWRVHTGEQRTLAC